MFRSSLAVPARKILIYRERMMELLSRRHKWRPRKRNKYGQIRRNHLALHKQKEASIVERALPYWHVVITSTRVCVTRKKKCQLKFKNIMSTNTWQVKTRMPKACSAPVCFRKTVTAEVESAAELVWNGITRFSPLWKVKFNLRYVLVAKKKKLKFYSVAVVIHISIFIFISSVHAREIFVLILV